VEKASTKRATAAHGPVILLGHSYGGVVIVGARGKKIGRTFESQGIRCSRNLRLAAALARGDKRFELDSQEDTWRTELLTSW
jgi:hypothetical protein